MQLQAASPYATSGLTGPDPSEGDNPEDESPPEVEDTRSGIASIETGIAGIQAVDLEIGMDHPLKLKWVPNG